MAKRYDRLLARASSNDPNLTALPPPTTARADRAALVTSAFANAQEAPSILKARGAAPNALQQYSESRATSPAQAMRIRQLIQGAGGGGLGVRTRAGFAGAQAQDAQAAAEEARKLEQRAAALEQREHEKRIATIKGPDRDVIRGQTAKNVAEIRANMATQESKSAYDRSLELQKLKGEQELGQIDATGAQRLKAIALTGEQDIKLLDREIEAAEAKGDVAGALELMKGRARIADTLIQFGKTPEATAAGAEKAVPGPGKDLNNDGIVDAKDKQIAALNKVLVTRDLTPEEFQNVKAKLAQLRQVKVEKKVE